MFNHLTDKVIPHGADEVGNSLYGGGSAYLPWPGAGGPAPIEAPPAEEGQHAALDGGTYTDQLNDAAKRGGNDTDRGHSR
jgi:hypothetical protein